MDFLNWDVLMGRRGTGEAAFEWLMVVVVLIMVLASVGLAAAAINGIWNHVFVSRGPYGRSAGVVVSRKYHPASSYTTTQVVSNVPIHTNHVTPETWSVGIELDVPPRPVVRLESYELYHDGEGTRVPVVLYREVTRFGKHVRWDAKLEDEDD